MRLGSRSALDQLGGSGPYEEAAAILRDRGADRRTIGLHRGGIGDFEFDDEIRGHGGLPWRSVWGLAAYGAGGSDHGSRVSLRVWARPA